MENQKKETNYYNVYDMVFGLYNGYLNDYMQVYSEENGIDDLDEVEEEDIYSIIYDDLTDKEFTEEEVEEITLREIKNEETLYKLGAYMIALYEQPEDYKEWKDIIKNDVKAELPDEEIKKLWEALDKVDF